MFRKRLSFWVTLLIVFAIAGCNPGERQGPVEFLATRTLPDEAAAQPSPEASMTPPEEIKPTDEIASTTPVTVALANPGFEEQAADGSPAGWTVRGTKEAVQIEDRGHSGNLRLTHKGSAAYQVETSQTVTGLASGWYTLRAWVRSGGEQQSAYMALACGNQEKQVILPSTMPGYRWLNLAVSNQVTDGQCTIRLVSNGTTGTWASFDDLELVPGQAALSILGADISSLKKSEDLGGVYKDTDGTPGDALEILKSHGLNYARLRVWVDPADGYHNKEKLLIMAQRLKGQGIKLLVDFHYSDSWADPGKQNKPAAWKDLDFEGLKKALYDHTYDVCSSLAAQGTPPDMVQVGNEINAGLLWPDGDYNHFDNMTALLKEGYQAVKDSSPSTQVMLHIAEGGDNDLARWWFDNITRREVPFDVIGISYYPYWHGSLPQLQYNLNDISARYDKDVIVVETSYAFTYRDSDGYPNIAGITLRVEGYPYSPEGQRAMLRDVMAVVRAVPGGRGLGVFYWDATWTAVKGNGWDNTNSASGNAWENQALFDFDWKVLPALDEYLNP